MYSGAAAWRPLKVGSSPRSEPKAVVGRDRESRRGDQRPRPSSDHHRGARASRSPARRRSDVARSRSRRQVDGEDEDTEWLAECSDRSPGEEDQEEQQRSAVDRPCAPPAPPARRHKGEADRTERLTPARPGEVDRPREAEEDRQVPRARRDPPRRRFDPEPFGEAVDCRTQFEDHLAALGRDRSGLAAEDPTRKDDSRDVAARGVRILKPRRPPGPARGTLAACAPICTSNMTVARVGKSWAAVRGQTRICCRVLSKICGCSTAASYPPVITGGSRHNGAIRTGRPSNWTAEARLPGGGGHQAEAGKVTVTGAVRRPGGGPREAGRVRNCRAVLLEIQ